ncbi:hypothetical protein DPEC_G00210520 [Dallia pectoralis]|uniref:Uncharacterized protein n=1 Tax=Dallia pectoralis TaxID=75939 RepID=A0ACC2G622_DALPE|nr:hypothetical protein DPEC_G00210520 [Dallia pectoralis]
MSRGPRGDGGPVSRSSAGCISRPLYNGVKGATSNGPLITYRALRRDSRRPLCSSPASPCIPVRFPERRERCPWTRSLSLRGDAYCCFAPALSASVLGLRRTAPARCSMVLPTWHSDL